MDEGEDRILGIDNKINYLVYLNNGKDKDK